MFSASRTRSYELQKPIRVFVAGTAGLLFASGLVALASMPVRAETRSGHLLTYPATVTAEGPTFVHDDRAIGAKIEIKQIDADNSTVIELRVTNLRGFAGKTVGAHVHTKPCSADPAASGPHYANPVADKTTALGAREVWMDFTVDSLGRGIGIAIFDWKIKAGDANSVVIHAESTNQTSGAAGARVMCTDLKLGK
jgi:superoxide dismutase, Cu-Zn family